MRNLKLYFLPIGAIVLLLWCLLFASSVYGSMPTETVTLTQAEYVTHFNTVKSKCCFNTHMEESYVEDGEFQYRKR